MQRLSGLSILVLIVLFLASCGSTDTPLRDATIRGTVNAPNGGNVLGTVVSLCYQGDCQDTRGQSITIAQSGTSSSFSFSDLESGTRYTIRASKDSDSNGVVDESEYQGSWSSVTAPAQDINIFLNVGSRSDHAKSKDNTFNQTPNVSMTGTWTGTSTTAAYGEEQTTIDLTQNGAALSGTLTLTSGSDSFSTSISGSLTADTVSLSGVFEVIGSTGQTGTVTYSYEGTVANATFTGSLLLTFTNGTGTNETGSFTLAQEAGQPDPTEPDPTLNMTGTWTGETTTDAYGLETTLMTLTQTGTSLSGRLTLNPGDFSTELTGSTSGNTVTLEGSYSLDNNAGNVTYTYQGTVSEGSYSGTITLSSTNGYSETGSFNLTQDAGQPDPVEPEPDEPAANVTGTWNGTMTFANGSTATFTTVLTQRGAFVDGSITLAGVVDGDDYWSAQSFQIIGHVSNTRLALAGYRSRALEFTGLVTGDSMSGQGSIILSNTFYKFTYTATSSGG